MTAAHFTAPADFISELRHATRKEHTLLESTPVSQRLLGDEVSINDYRNYLLKMRDIIAFCETEVFPLVEHIVPGIELRRKLPLLESDLQQAGGATAIAAPFRPWQRTPTTAIALGYMYVLEGSTLGGRIILKHLQAKPGLLPPDSGAFFAGYGASTGSAWKSFLHSLQLYVADTNSAAAVIEGAKHAYNAIYDHFVQ